jgi:hypothetical protein
MTSLFHISKGFVFAEKLIRRSNNFIAGDKEGVLTGKFALDQLSEFAKCVEKYPFTYYPDDKDSVEDAKAVFDFFDGSNIILDMTNCNSLTRPELIELLPTHFAELRINYDTFGSALLEKMKSIQLEKVVFIPSRQIKEEDAMIFSNTNVVEVRFDYRSYGESTIPGEVLSKFLMTTLIVEMNTQLFGFVMPETLEKLVCHSGLDFAYSILANIPKLPKHVSLGYLVRKDDVKSLVDILYNKGCEHLDLQVKGYFGIKEELEKLPFTSIKLNGEFIKGKSGVELSNLLF